MDISEWISGNLALAVVIAVVIVSALLTVCCCYWRCCHRTGGKLALGLVPRPTGAPLPTAPGSGGAAGRGSGAAAAQQLLTASVTELALAVRSGAVSATELTKAFTAQLQRHNRTVNAVVALRLENALAEAAHMDTRYAAAVKTGAHAVEALPPLFGVPCTVSEACAVDGMPNSGGVWGRRKLVASADSVVVQRLCGAGAIVLGVTNGSELACGVETANTVHGATRNPYAFDRASGGGAGGEAVAQALCASAFGVGVDIGGALRIAAGFNGVFAHKPTGGTPLSTAGCFPPVSSALNAVGPVCRYARDLWPLLQALAGPVTAPAAAASSGGAGAAPSVGTPRSAGAVALTAAGGWRSDASLRPDAVSIETLTVYYVRDPVNGAVTPADEDVIVTCDAVLNHFKAKKCRVQSISLVEFASAHHLWMAARRTAELSPADAATTSSTAGGAAQPSVGSLLFSGRCQCPLSIEFMRHGLGCGHHTYPALRAAAAESCSEGSSACCNPQTTEQWMTLARELRERLNKLLSDDAILIFPTYPTAAPKTNSSLWSPNDAVYSALWNVTECPVTQVPLGLTAEGVPLGIQVVGACGRDHLTIAVALELESAFGGYRIPGAAAERLPFASVGPYESMSITVRSGGAVEAVVRSDHSGSAQTGGASGGGGGASASVNNSNAMRDYATFADDTKR